MMIQQNLFNIQDEIDTPVGYKKTEVGIIPSDWETPKFGEICTLINGRGFKPYEWSKRGLPIIRIQNLNGSDDFNYYEGPYDPKIFIENGQLLFAWSGSRGTSFGPHIWKGQNALLNYHTWKLNINHSKVDDKYFYHILKSLTKIIEDSAHGASALVHTQKGEMEQFDIPLPPSRIEQEKIATVLSDTDVLISELEKLIEKKQAIKTATMQQLLTGKTRLPEFALHEDGKPKGYKNSELGKIPEDWEVYKLSDVSLIDPENLNSSTSPNYEFEYISLENVYKGVLLGTTTQIFSASPSRARRVLRSGDILISTVRPNLMSHYYFNKAQRDVVCSTGFSVARPIQSKLNGLFFYYHLFETVINKQIDKIVIGSNYPAINSNDIRNFKVMLPCLREQSFIVEILEQLDLEIEKEFIQLNKLKNIKQGMMQELLTGKTRLV